MNTSSKIENYYGLERRSWTNAPANDRGCLTQTQAGRRPSHLFWSIMDQNRDLGGGPVVFAEPASQPVSSHCSATNARRSQARAPSQASVQISRRERARRLLNSLEVTVQAEPELSEVASPAPEPEFGTLTGWGESRRANSNGYPRTAAGRRKQSRKGGQ